MKELAKILNNDWDVRIQRVFKNVKPSPRHRFVWRARIQISIYREVRIESKWEGFARAESCITDLIKKLSGYKKENAQELVKRYKNARELVE